MIREWRRGEFTISTDPSRLDLDVIHGFLAQSYWAAGIRREVVERSIRHSICFGAFDGERPVGLAIVHPAFEPLLAWLAFLHVSRPYRRRGAAQALWNVAADIATANGAESIYVSATPTGSAVGFYLRQGCRLAQPVHPDLFAAEPEDIHLVRSLR